MDLSLSTLADKVGACTAALMPLYRLIEGRVLAAGRLHGDDTTVPVLAKGKTDINGRSAQERLGLRQELSAPLVADLAAWMRENRVKLSKNSAVAEPMDYMLPGRRLRLSSMTAASALRTTRQSEL